MKEQEYKEIIKTLKGETKRIDWALEIPSEERQILQDAIYDLINILTNHTEKNVVECLRHTLEINKEKLISKFSKKELQNIFYSAQVMYNYLALFSQANKTYKFQTQNNSKLSENIN